ncbi:MAG TPA: hypothetical protein VD862_04390 [Candidatus Paceibacterota bacterium]|nr:hypothetical protein [Candidatus Paceibacterota bacterium]
MPNKSEQPQAVPQTESVAPARAREREENLERAASRTGELVTADIKAADEVPVRRRGNRLRSAVLLTTMAVTGFISETMGVKPAEAGQGHGRETARELMWEGSYFANQIVDRNLYDSIMRIQNAQERMRQIEYQLQDAQRQRSENAGELGRINSELAGHMNTLAAKPGYLEYATQHERYLTLGHMRTELATALYGGNALGAMAAIQQRVKEIDDERAAISRQLKKIAAQHSIDEHQNQPWELVEHMNLVNEQYRRISEQMRLTKAMELWTVELQGASGALSDAESSRRRNELLRAGIQVGTTVLDTILRPR